MIHCKDCKYAEWYRTDAGRLHPSGQGECRYPWKLPPLPQAMYWVTGLPIPGGGVISRNKPLKGHCTYYSRAEIKGPTK